MQVSGPKALFYYYYYCTVMLQLDVAINYHLASMSEKLLVSQFFYSLIRIIFSLLSK